MDEAQVLLLWTIQNNVVAITSSTREENLRKLVEVDGLVDLTEEERKEIEEVGRKVHFRHYTVSQILDLVQNLRWHRHNRLF